MSSCSPGSESPTRMGGTRDPGPPVEEILLAGRAVGENLRQTDLSVPAIHCGGCIQAIERALHRLDGVVEARVSMAPSGAADAGRNAADFVFLRDGLEAAPLALAVSRCARRLIRQNFALAFFTMRSRGPLSLPGSSRRSSPLW